MALNGLTSINLELTSRCNKSCWMCGRRKRDLLVGDLKYGDIDFSLVEKVAKEIPPGVVVQFHNNGEGFLYPRFGEAVSLFKHCVTGVVTNGKLLVQKVDEIVDNLDVLSISVVENDPEAQIQYETILRFLQIKGDRKPYTTLRFVGNISIQPYQGFGLLIVSRTLHAPEGSVEYKKQPVVPEIGVCWDFLTRLAIDRLGNVSTCVRFDPDGELVLGNIKTNTLDELWNGEKRSLMKMLHCSGRRKEISYCGDKCDYWGIPVGK